MYLLIILPMFAGAGGGLDAIARETRVPHAAIGFHEAENIPVHPGVSVDC